MNETLTVDAMDCLFRLGHNHRLDYINGKHKEDYDIVEQTIVKSQEIEQENDKLTKAIDVIINKCVNFIYFHNNQTIDYYNKHVADWRQLSSEEFELVKTYYELYKNKMNEKQKENL